MRDMLFTIFVIRFTIYGFSTSNTEHSATTPEDRR
jgi:hypothetical protein